MDWSFIISIIITAIISSIGSGFVISQQSGRDYHQLLLNQIKGLQADVNTVTSEKNELLSRILHLEKDLVSVRVKMQMLESVHQDLPVPMWLKDRSGVMLMANKAYERTFLIPIGKTLEDYIGHEDGNVWPKEIADQYRAHDRHVLDIGHKVELWEPVSNAAGETKKWLIVKYPQIVGGTTIGVAGIAIATQHRIQDQGIMGAS